MEYVVVFDQSFDPELPGVTLVLLPMLIQLCAHTAAVQFPHLSMKKKGKKQLLSAVNHNTQHKAVLLQCERSGINKHTGIRHGN